MKFLIIDDYYPEALDYFYQSNPGIVDAPYEEHRQWLMGQNHGTADYWEKALIRRGHEATTWVTNSKLSRPDYEPEFVIAQNVGQPIPMFSSGPRLVAFCSYRAEDVNLKDWDLVVTSFPHYMGRLKSLGQRALFLPLAFDPSVLPPVPYRRTLPITFFGGLGHNHIWRRGTEVLEAVASSFDEFLWGGYASQVLPPRLALSHIGDAWGKHYFRFLASSQITLNRHGEIAAGYANNMRLFEATGCGACLVTEEAPNLSDYFEVGKECVTYRSAGDLIVTLRRLLNEPEEVAAIAEAGQKRCLAEHTYDHRCEVFLDAVQSL